MKVSNEFVVTFATLQVCLCSVAALILFSIWMGGFKSGEEKHVKDPGIGFLSLACATWAFAGIVLLLFRLEPFGLIYRPLISVLNSLFIIAAVAHFDVIEPHDRVIGFLAKLLRPAHNVWIAIGLVMVTYIVLTRSAPLHNVLDVVLSVFALLALSYGLSVSFWRRGFHLLALFAAGILLAQLAAQLPELADVSILSQMFSTGLIQSLLEIRWPLLVVSKSMVCMLFIALAFSWMHEKVLKLMQSNGGDQHSVTPVVPPSEGKEELRVKILPPLNPHGGHKTTFDIEIHSPAFTQRISLKEKAYLRIIELLQAREHSDGWLSYDDTYPLCLKDPLADVEKLRQQVRQEYQDIWRPVRIGIPLIIQTDEEQDKRRIWPELVNVKVEDREKIAAYKWTHTALWEHLKRQGKQPESASGGVS